MLEELCKYENLGTPGFHLELLGTLSESQGQRWKQDDISALFHNRIIDGRSVFDGCLPLLIAFELITINSESELQIDPSFDQYLVSEALFIDRLVEKMVQFLKNDSIFHDIFCSEYISLDVIYRSIQIENAAFPLRHSAFKQLLIDFNFLTEHPQSNFPKYIINSRYKKIFDKVVLPEIRKRKVGIEELRRSLEQQQIYGEEAEKFVLDFEKKRLKHRGNEVIWVAEYSVADGYDIASLHSEESEKLDRFIEVKSYIGTPYFFWSRNEIEVARIKKKNYFLYLVNRKQLERFAYKPIMIQDPYKNVLKAEEFWDQRYEKIKFTWKNSELVGIETSTY